MAHRREDNTLLMTTQKPAQDGQLQPARAELSNAISQLIDPQSHSTPGQTIYIPSLYQQLTEAVPGSFLGRTTGTPRSQPPLWLDAADLLNQIDTTVRKWQPAGDAASKLPPTIRRLQLINQRTWRPQDTDTITHQTHQIQQWAIRIATLFAENHTKHITAPCPACGKTTIHKRDSTGELIRQPALQIGVHGCECMACHQIWGPQLFMHLARVLGYELPEGVLE